MIDKREEFLIFSAESTQMVIKAEKILKENSIECRIIPLPKEIDASCGLSIKTDLKNLNSVKSIFEKNRIDMSIYKIEKIGFKKKVDKC